MNVWGYLGAQREQSRRCASMVARVQAEDGGSAGLEGPTSPGHRKSPESVPDDPKALEALPDVHGVVIGCPPVLRCAVT